MNRERRAWALFALVAAGWAFGLAIAGAVGPRGFEVAIGGLGGAAGYGVFRFLSAREERRGQRGQIKYWRGQRFYDDEP